MMNNDTLDFFGFFDRPDERMPIFFCHHIDGRILLWEIRFQIHTDIANLFLIFERRCGFWDIFLGFHLGIDWLPGSTVDVAERFIRSPIGTLDDIGCALCLCQLSDSYAHATLLGIETDYGHTREKGM